jgi:phospholipid-binding lipoprotein MlaA
MELRKVLIILGCILAFGCSNEATTPNPVDLSDPVEISVQPATESTDTHAQISDDSDNEIVKTDTSDSQTDAPATSQSDEENTDEEEGADEFDEFDDFEDEFETKPGEEVMDPFEGYNRFMTDFNDGVYVYLLDPVARGYEAVIPAGARRSVNNFFQNLMYPVRLVNNVMQAKFKQAGVETLRFVINTTVGLLGLFDPAEAWFDLEPYPEDFGQTLGFWGVGAGPHVVLPFLGPSNLRDTISLYPDWQLDPISTVDSMEAQLGIRIYDTVNETSLHIGEYESLKKDAVDFYLFLRDAYEQNRIKKIEE